MPNGGRERGLNLTRKRKISQSINLAIAKSAFEKPLEREMSRGPDARSPFHSGDNGHQSARCNRPGFARTISFFIPSGRSKEEMASMAPRFHPKRRGIFPCAHLRTQGGIERPAGAPCSSQQLHTQISLEQRKSFGWHFHSRSFWKILTKSFYARFSSMVQRRLDGRSSDEQAVA